MSTYPTAHELSLMKVGELRKLAAEAGIKGRSKMNGIELEVALNQHFDTLRAVDENNRRFMDALERDEKTPAPKLERGQLVANRADRRAHRRSLSRRNDGSPRGGELPRTRTTQESQERREKSFAAGVKGNHYGNLRYGMMASGPRDIAVRVIDEGF